MPVVRCARRWPGDSGPGTGSTRQITGSPATSAVRVLILTIFGLDEYVFAALRAGASGFLLKDTPPTDLLAAIRVIAAGDALLAPALTRWLIAEFTRLPEPEEQPATTLHDVTEREREVHNFPERLPASASRPNASETRRAQSWLWRRHMRRLRDGLGHRLIRRTKCFRPSGPAGSPSR